MRELWFESDGAADAAASASGHAAAVDADAIPGDDDGNAAPRCRLSITRRRSPTWPTTSTSNSRCRKRTTWDPAPRTRPFGSVICITGWTKIISTAVLLPPARGRESSWHAVCDERERECVVCWGRDTGILISLFFNENFKFSQISILKYFVKMTTF